MWSTRLTVVALVVAGRTVSAQAADGSGKGLDLCIETARGADATCSKLADDPAQRLECFQKARAVQLECLEQALPDPPTGTTASESHPETSQPGQPAATASPDSPAQAASSIVSNLSAPALSRVFLRVRVSWRKSWSITSQNSI